MKILKISGIILLGFIAVIIVLGLVSPNNFMVERSVVIPTTNKEVIFKNVSVWKDFLKWNPWIAKYPDQKITFKGDEGKVGSGYRWEGNDDAGKGEMSLAGLKPYERVDMDLHFIEPWESTNKTVFTIDPERAGYKVNWQMSGSSSFPLNIMHLFMDKMIGPDFERGLKKLKEKVLKEEALSVKTTTDGIN